MLDIADELNRWAGQGRPFAVATVVEVGGSAPRQLGAALAVDGAGTALGSVSGGCVEGAVYELCRQVLDDGSPVRERFDHRPEDAFAVGLTCGGTLDVLVTRVDGGVVAEGLAAAAAGRPVALARISDGPPGLLGRALLVRADGSFEGSLGVGPGPDRAAADEAGALLDAGRTGSAVIGEDGGRCGRPLTLFVESRVPAPRMIVFGAIDFASALVRVGRFLGYRVTVCDARPVFATPARFPDADEIVVEWPHRYLAATEVDARTVLCVLTHDPKFDVPLLALALKLPVGYVGAMGSRRTHRDRTRRLREAGASEAELSRLRSPIGLDLGARTPQETALSIAAEIVADRHGGSGVPLSAAAHPAIHRRPRASVPSSAGPPPG
ncbi:XdhC family protein [Streptomyces lydicus]|uniref:XdhC family protein n=1 Tax=Streptomyces lydicus TaxID=47763 RepID=UPI0037D94764